MKKPDLGSSPKRVVDYIEYLERRNAEIQEFYQSVLSKYDPDKDRNVLVVNEAFGDFVLAKAHDRMTAHIGDDAFMLVVTPEGLTVHGWLGNRNVCVLPRAANSVLISTVKK